MATPAADAVASDIPAGLTEAVQVLLRSSDRKARKAAVEAVLAHEPKEAVALYARNIAWLDRAGSCEAKKTVLKKITKTGDARALPALQLLSKAPRKGCGIFDQEDCLECLRELLAKTIGQLEGAG